ncbi:alkyl sulfatase dimerization domain-containing protein [Nocardia sp. NPDC051833]|uniref:alkyl/aryl-sulfatase n=1 Tax=Nocardia sp. NPDC051833 TaxID=3155674 RepID=UPI0034410D00
MAADFKSRTDFDNADRGWIASLDPCVITNSDGRAVWDMEAYSFLGRDCPDSADPSLWRQGQLCSRHGLFQVTDRIYQIRGFDLSNMTLVEGDTGVIVIDPLVSVEVAAAGLRLYREQRGDKPVTGVIYTHSHVDHFGGVEGVVSVQDVHSGKVPVIAPEGFLEHAVSENVYAGNAMGRRGTYHTGVNLEPGPKGQIGDGLGITNSTGRISLIPPTLDITESGQVETVDGVRIEFQLTPGTEAPSEMNFLFPNLRALCLAENATHNLHNLLTLRGALVRDARVWSRYLNDALRLFGARCDVVFASHHWPTWGHDEISAFLTIQRDLYGYLHDQSLRLLNQGLTGAEIAEVIEMPPALDDAWHTHGYYGSVSHNVKAIYQRYLGWFDGNPARLWQHPPQEASRRYVECMGGVSAVVEKAQKYAADGDLRFAAELLDRAVFADPADTPAKHALADVLERLGYGSENGTWRNFFLTGAMELRTGIKAQPVDIGGGMAMALTIEQLFDSIASRVDGPKAWIVSSRIDWRLTDLSELHRTELSNGALIHFTDPTSQEGKADLTLTLTKPQLLALVAGHGLDGVEHTGDLQALERLTSVLVQYDPNFPIMTP